MKQCLIIGYGSIGRRHASILKNLNVSVSIVTSQNPQEFPHFSHISAALQSAEFDYVIVANATGLHFQTLKQLAAENYQGIVLVEKPLFAHSEDLPVHSFKKIVVAYNLRFHPLLQELKGLLQNEKLITFSAYVGQYLPIWRKNIDYRYSYSAQKEQGGGVLRDLSHELDYTILLCGRALSMTAMGGQWSTLEIASDDVFSILLQCERCPIVNIHLNYLNRKPRREIIINTDQHTLTLDFIQGTLSIDGELKNVCQEGGTLSYIRQHEALMEQDFSEFCQYADGKYLVNLIESIEEVSQKKVWTTA